MVEAFRRDKSAPFFGFLGATTTLVFSYMGAAYGTAKSGVGVASMGVMWPVLVMKSIVPVIMAGVLGIYLDSRPIKSSLPILQFYMFLPTGISILPNERSFKNLTLLYELDISNNRFVGPYMPSLKYLDIRFNDFEGSLPKKLFDKDLDAIFVNNNRSDFEIPSNLGNSPVSVIIFANNNLKGCIPPSLGNMAATLNEIVLLNSNLSGCLPSDITLLKHLTVFRHMIDINYGSYMC
jgi:hypothetical protein